jgi:glucose-1-phosphatase
MVINPRPDGGGFFFTERSPMDVGQEPLECLILDLGNVLAFHDNDKMFAALARLFETNPQTLKSQFDSTFWRRVHTGELPGAALCEAMNHRLNSRVTSLEFAAAWSCHFSLNTPMVERVQSLVGRIKLVLLSNAHDWHFEYLRPLLPILQRFDALVLSYEVHAMKPEPEIYRHALAAAQCPPSRCAFFDDVETYALEARALGIKGRVFRDVSNFNSELKQMGFND